MTLTENMQEFLNNKGVLCIIKGDVADFSPLTLDLIKAKIKNGDIEIIQGNVTGKLITELVSSIDLMTLASVKAEALDAIAEAVEEYGTKFIGTKGIVQLEGYKRKAILAAKAIKTDKSPNGSLEAEAEIRGISVQSLSGMIMNRANQTDQIQDLIETVRVQANAAISGAKSVDEVNAILASFAQQAEQKFKSLQG